MKNGLNNWTKEPSYPVSLKMAFSRPSSTKAVISTQSSCLLGEQLIVLSPGRMFRSSASLENCSKLCLTRTYTINVQRFPFCHWQMASSRPSPCWNYCIKLMLSLLQTWAMTVQRWGFPGVTDKQSFQDHLPNINVILTQSPVSKETWNMNAKSFFPSVINKWPLQDHLKSITPPNSRSRFHFC